MTQPTLAEPVIVSEFLRNRRGESIRLTLTTWQGRTIADLRIWCTSPEGQLKPSPKGVACHIKHLAKLKTAFAKAERRARELGLIATDDDGERS